MAQTARLPSRSLSDFRGDYGALSALMERSWGENAESSLHYTSAFLRSAFEYPGTRVDLAPTMYEGERPVAFVAGFPRLARYEGRDLRLLVGTFLTSAPEFKGTTIGPAMWTEFLKRARAAGYDGAINFCAEGSPSNGVVTACGRRLGLSTQKVFTISYLLRLLRPVAAAPADQPQDSDVHLFVELTRERPSRAALARLWTHEEAEWQCHKREGAICVSLRASGRRGLLTGSTVEVLGTPPVRTLLLEDLLWDDLDADERVHLLDRTLAVAAGQGVQIASVPLMGYADVTPLLTRGFRKSRRLMHTYLTVWNGPEPATPLPNLYMDVL